MNTEQLSKMLLFSVETSSYPYKYRLYFVEQDTLYYEKPVLHCFYVRSKKIFDSAVLGGVYVLSYCKSRIKSMTLCDTLKLGDSDYFFLCENRDRKFRNSIYEKRTNNESGIYAPQELYYDFNTARDIFEYNPSSGKKTIVFIIRLAVYLLSIIIPVGLYLLFTLTLTLKLPQIAHGYLASISVPLLALMSLPFIIWLMIMLYTMCEVLLLNIEYTRYILIKLYFLRWAGMRRSCHIESHLRRKLLTSGIVTTSLLVVTLILTLFIF